MDTQDIEGSGDPHSYLTARTARSMGTPIIAAVMIARLMRQWFQILELEQQVRTQVVRLSLAANHPW